MNASTAFFDWFGAMGTGITGMGELIIITLLAGGMLETIRYNGGIDFIIARLTRHVTGKRGAELSIAALEASPIFAPPTTPSPSSPPGPSPKI